MDLGAVAGMLKKGATGSPDYYPLVRLIKDGYVSVRVIQGLAGPHRPGLQELSEEEIAAEMHAWVEAGGKNVAYVYEPFGSDHDWGTPSLLATVKADLYLEELAPGPTERLYMMGLGVAISLLAGLLVYFASKLG
jgi:hypothetical protein